MFAPPKGGRLELDQPMVVAGGFEPPKHIASDLKSLPFDLTREYYHVPIIL